MNPFNFTPKLVMAKTEIKANPAEVGKAVSDIYRNPVYDMTVQDVIEEYQEKYCQEVMKAVEVGLKEYQSPFYVVVLHKKESWTDNVLRNWFVARQTRPLAKVLRNDYPNHSHTVYEHGKDGQMKLMWTLPTAQDANSILKSGQLYDTQLVGWIMDFNQGKLDQVND